MKPRIAIPIPHTDSKYSSRTLPQYKAAIEDAGGEAVEIPLTLSNAEIANLCKTCDGVLLPGSPADVDPEKFGVANRHPLTAPADPLRDNVDELLLQDAHNMRKPLLGICYGVQSLNVWRNGSLVQHIESQVQHTRRDDQPRGTVIRHEALIDPASRLASIVRSALNINDVGPIQITVNSSHHQSVERPGDGLKVVARSRQDDIIEAVEGTAREHWVLGVQWHPERTFAEDGPSRAIFRALVEAAKKWHEKTIADFETVRR